MEILYNYKPYEVSKVGVFEVETGEYKLPGRWVKREEENIIIGETDDCYVTRLLESGCGEWVGDGVVKREYILPIGLHKTRLIRWMAR